MSDIKRASVMACALAAVVFIFSCTRDDNHIAYGDKAPDFTLSDISGSPVSLSSLKGKVVLLEFWATWCPPCKEAIPELRTIHEKYKERGFVLLGVSVDKGADSRTAVSSYVKRHSITYPVLLDDNNTNGSYSVTSIPTSFIIDKTGKVVNRRIGFIPGSADNISKEIEALL